jgi:arsenate reductase
MAEIGIATGWQQSTLLDQHPGESFDTVITVCDQANEACMVFPGAGRRLHWSFDDPSPSQGTLKDQLAVFRRMREEDRLQIEDELRTRRSCCVTPERAASAPPWRKSGAYGLRSRRVRALVLVQLQV